MRLRDAEAILERDGLGPAAIEAASARAAELVEPDADVHASADYRRHLVGVLTARALRKAADRSREPSKPGHPRSEPGSRAPLQ